MDDTGGMYGAMCALTGLYHRNMTGQGQHIDLSQMVASVPLVGTALLDLVLDDDDRAAVEAAGHGGSLAAGVAPSTARFRIKTGDGIRRLEVRFTTMVGVFGAALVGTMRELESSSCSQDRPSLSAIPYSSLAWIGG